MTKPTSKYQTPIYEEARESLRLWSVKYTGGCAIQQAENGKLWPCGTCFNALLGKLLGTDKTAYNEHNKPVDRINEVWRAILQIRD